MGLSEIWDRTVNSVKTTYDSITSFPGKIIDAHPQIRDLPQQVVDAGSHGLKAVGSLATGDLDAAGAHASQVGRAGFSIAKTTLVAPGTVLTTVARGQDAARQYSQMMDGAIDKGADALGSATVAAGKGLVDVTVATGRGLKDATVAVGTAVVAGLSK